jgi:hypothetical protein
MFRGSPKIRGDRRTIFRTPRFQSVTDCPMTPPALDPTGRLEAGLIRRLSFKGLRYPGEVIRDAVWLYFRFILSLRDAEELAAQRGVEVSREVVPLLSRQVRTADVALVLTLQSFGYGAHG